MNHAPVHDISHKSALAPAHEGQQHPLGVYFKDWGLLFVLSSMSYALD
jgi:cytochrome c oxidase subunit IV